MLSAYLKTKQLFRIVTAKYSSDLLTLGLYLILTLVLLYPFSILKINTQLIGMDAGDTYQGLWSLWWVRQSVLSFTSPYTTQYIFHPIGTDLFAHSLSPAAGLFTIPFQLTLGLVFSYNLLIILSFVLSGYGAFRLAYHITKDKHASFFSGLVFGFSTYHFARAWGQLNLVSIQWIPLYVLFLLKMRKEPSLKNSLFAAFFLILSTLWADFHYLIFLGLLSFFVVSYDVLFNRERVKNYWMRLLIMLAVFFGIIALFLGPLFYSLLTGKYSYAWSLSIDLVSSNSADLLGFFFPSSFNPLFGKYTTGIITHFSNPWIEGIVYIGYTVMALAIFAAIKLWKKAKLWLLGAFAFIILSLGPFLHVFGFSSFTTNQVSIPLPEWLLFYIFPIPRAPSRFIVIVMLYLAVVSAISLRHINAWFAKFRRGKILGLLFFVCISGSLLTEVSMVPFPVVENSTVPAFYKDLAEISGTFAVLDLPQNYDASARCMYYGTVSEKPLVGGSISRVPPANLEFLQIFPVINQMNNAEQGKGVGNWTDILLQNANITNLNAFFFFNVKYVILHRDMTNHLAFKQMEGYLCDLLGQPIYSDGQMIAFDTNATHLYDVFAYLSSGWRALEDVNSLRWMDGKGVVDIISPSSQYYDVSFFAATQVENKHLQVFLNDEEVGNFEISVNDFSEITLDGLYFRQGNNKLLFFSEQFFIPAEIIANSSDTGPLSIAFKNIRIAPQL